MSHGSGFGNTCIFRHLFNQFRFRHGLVSFLGVGLEFRNMNTTPSGKSQGAGHQNMIFRTVTGKFPTHGHHRMKATPAGRLTPSVDRYDKSLYKHRVAADPWKEF